MILHGLLAVLLALQAATTPPSPKRLYPSGPNDLSGRVVDNRGKPLPDVIVKLTVVGNLGAPETLSDSDGRFAFERIAAGRMIITPTLRGYVMMDSSVPTFGGEPVVGVANEARLFIDAKPGERHTDVLIRMEQGARISGRVSIEGTDTAANISVSALPISGKVPRVVHSARTNAFGEFEITVPTGEYLLRAAGPSKDGIEYVSAFYPGVQTQREAAAIRVSAGDVAAGVEFVLRPDVSYTLRGRVLAAGGTGRARITLTASPGNSTRTATTSADGTFVFSKLKPGRYMLSAQIGAGSEAEGAWQAVVIADMRHDVEVRLEPAGTIRGRIITEDGVSVDLEGARVGAALSDDANDVDPLLPSQVNVDPDGTFVIEGVYGPRTLRVIGLPDNWTVKSVSIGGSEATAPHVTVHPRATVDGVTIVIARHEAGLDEL